MLECSGFISPMTRLGANRAANCFPEKHKQSQIRNPYVGYLEVGKESIVYSFKVYDTFLWKRRVEEVQMKRGRTR